MNNKIRPIIWGFRTVFYLLILKLLHNVKGLKYFFAPNSAFRFDGGNLNWQGRGWLETGSLLHLAGGDITLGKDVFINKNTIIVSAESIQIGNDVLLADNVSIYDHDHLTSQVDIPYGKQGYITAPVIIDDNVWVGSHSVILKGVHIGKGAIVAAGSIVNNNIPEYQVWGGVPAKFIKSIEHS
jgi:acetyltransferase-like isoleucine patch superfamily enzyme